MSDKRSPIHMPAPRDHADPTLSEIMPFRSRKINLKKSPVVYFLLLLAISAPMLFSSFGVIFSSENDKQFMSNLVFYSATITFVLCATLQSMIFMYARSGRPFLHYWFAFVVVCILLISPALMLFFFIFRELSPLHNPEAVGFVPVFLSMFSGAGLMEELLKGVPVLLGAWVGVRARKEPAFAQKGWAAFIAVRGPLDGALMGVFAGGAFTFIETGLQYVPNQMMDVFKATKDTGISVAAAFLLLIPRALGAAVGHIAYSGIFGYFIGLAVLRPSAMVKLLLIGWLTSATIHAFWNSAGEISSILYYVIAGVSAIGLASVLLKARQLEQGRTGIAAESHGSIMVERPVAPPPAAQSPTVERRARNAAPAASAAFSVEQALALDIGGLRIPLRADAQLDPASEPALGGRGAGVKGLVVAHPSRAGVLGLRNVGQAAWTAYLRDGKQQQIGPDQNIRLAPGVTIQFAAGLSGLVIVAG